MLKSWRKVRWPLLGALIAALVTAAVAGATHIGPFDLGHTNVTPAGAQSGVSGNANSAVLFGANSNTGASAHGVQGSHTATSGIGAGVRGFTNSTSSNARGVLGQVLSAAPGSQSAGVRGINNGTGANGIGVFGSQAGSGEGVRGQAASGTGVVGLHTATTGTGAGVEGQTSSLASGAAGVRGTAPSGFGAVTAGVQGIITSGAEGYGVWGTADGTSGIGVRGDSATNIGVLGSGGSSSFAGVGVTGIGGSSQSVGVRGTGGFAGVEGDTSSSNGYAGLFHGKTEVRGNLHVGGDIHGREGSSICPKGAANGIAQVDASPTFSSSYVDVPGFNCVVGGTVQAKRNGVGNYTVRFGGNASATFAVGNSTETTNDDFVIVKLVGTGVAGREFQVISFDKDGGMEDGDFVIVAF
jgi:hypothetical protein